MRSSAPEPAIAARCLVGAVFESLTSWLEQSPEHRAPAADVARRSRLQPARPAPLLDAFLFHLNSVRAAATLAKKLATGVRILESGFSFDEIQAQH